MKILKHLLLIAIISLISACNNSSESDKKQETEVENHAEEGSNKLKMNGTEKWQANPETTEGINNMASLIDNYNANDQQNFAGLESELNTQFQLIFERCTMKGEAHNQLHNFLMPLKNKLENISEQNVSETRSYLYNYYDYFE